MLPIIMLISIISVYSLVYVKNVGVHPLLCLPCSENADYESIELGNKIDNTAVKKKILNEREYEEMPSSFFTEVEAKVEECITEQQNNYEDYGLFDCEYDAYEEMISTYKKYEQMFHNFYDDDFYKI